MQTSVTHKPLSAVVGGWENLNGLVLSYVNFVSGLLSRFAKRQTEKRLKTLQVELEFNNIPQGWIQGIHPTDLTSVWEKSGLSMVGVGYSTIGGLNEEKGISNRFFPDSNYYQAWLGGYIIKSSKDFGFKQDGSPNPEKLMQPAVSDQVQWLHNYGCKQPEVSIKASSFKPVEEIEFNGYRAWLMEGTILSNSDVGNHNRRANGYFMYRVYEFMFQRFSGIKLPPLSTLPPHLEVDSYHPIELDGLALFVPIEERKTWVIIYGCGARLNNQNHFQTLREEIKNTLLEARIHLS